MQWCSEEWSLKTNYRKENKMKKMLLVIAAVVALNSLTACMGVRGHDGSGKVCENDYFFGISLIEAVSPCGR